MCNWVLGIASSHDGAACLLEDGEIRYAIREERLSGVKRQRAFAGRGNLSVRYCLDSAGITASDLRCVAAATQRAASELENDLSLNPDLRHAPRLERLTLSHHLAHAASAVALSGFDSCAILVCDGLGSPVTEVQRSADTRVLGPADGWEHLTLFHARGTRIEPLEIHSCTDWVRKRDDGLWGFGSLGGMYASISHFLFGNADEAGKVMGLAPYGEPVFPTGEFLQLHDDRIVFSDAISTHFHGMRGHQADEPLRANLAASVQAALEAALLPMVRRLRRMTGETRVCLAGGIALNCTANQLIMQEGGFDEHFIVPASDDAGTAIGAAYLAHWRSYPTNPRRRARRDGFGRHWEKHATREAIAQTPGVTAETPPDLLEAVANRLVKGEIGGWMVGGCELGPRALGQRSIIASPISSDMKDRINNGVKFREPFRPFAPVVPEELASDWFDFGNSPIQSPFMLRAVPFRVERAADVPAVVHVDGSGRLQTLTEEDNGPLHGLALRFQAKTGIPILLNTSFNLKDEPIAETPEDAIWTLLATAMQFCVIGDQLVTKTSEIDSVLDLTPRVIAKSWTLKLPVEHGRLGRQSTAEDAFTFRVDTPWGETDIILPARLAPVVSAIDGLSNGHGMLDRLPAEERGIRQLIHDLLLLRRVRVIALENPAA